MITLETILRKNLACGGMAMTLMAGVCIAPGAYADDTSSPAVASLVSGNTLSVTNRYGPSMVYFDPSGRLRVTAGDSVSEGTWRADKDRVCSTMDSTPERVTPEYCIDLAGKKMGETWTGSDPKNGKLTFLLMPGDKSTRR